MFLMKETTRNLGHPPETSVGEAGNSYVPGEVEALMATIVNRLDYNLAYANASAVAGKHYPFPFNGGASLLGLLQAGYNAFQYDSGMNKLSSALTTDGFLPADSYVCQQLEAARKFALTVSGMTPDQLMNEYPYTFNLGEGRKPAAGAFNVTYFGSTVVYMQTLPWEKKK